MKNKKALSGVVTSVILVAVSISLIALVWVAVNNFVTDELDKSEACLNVASEKKVFLNNDYTCYDGNVPEIRFAIGVGNIELDSVLISFQGEDESKAYTITKDGSSPSGITLLDGSPAELPGKNAGYTYKLSYDNKPDRIQISPVIDGHQCEVADIISLVDNCQIVI